MMTFTESLKACRRHLMVLLLLLIALYAKIVPEMVQQWYQDENYSHGFLVPFIAGYFLYTRWAELKDAPVFPWKSGLLVIVFGLIQLLIGWLGTEYFTMRSSLIVLLAGLILSFFGTSVFRVLTLPLGYLFFMVPIPYIIYDAVAFPLKLFVTKVSVLTLKTVGVVVVREGNIIMFPATTLEVADACSGIRSLISLLALAVAFAFFIRITPWKRWLLICSAIPIAIFTNAMRVIITGFLAQYWGEKAAQGFFHEFAGLAVFGLAMVMLVSFGVLLTRLGQKAEDRGQSTEDRDQQKAVDREQKIEGREQKKAEGSEQSTENREQKENIEVVEVKELKKAEGREDGRISIPAFVAVLIMFVTVGMYINLHQDLQVPIKKSFDQFPTTISSWRMVGESYLSANVQKVLKATDTLSRQYVNADGKKVSLYIGYHGGGKGSGGIHSPKNCLPGSGWYEVSTNKAELDLAGEKINLVQAVYQKGSDKEVFIYWFQARSKTINDEYSLKLAEITNSILYRRRDTAFIRISVPFETDQQAAIAIGELFLRDVFPALQEFLPE